MGWFLKRGEQQSTPGMSLRDMHALHKKKIVWDWVKACPVLSHNEIPAKLCR